MNAPVINHPTNRPNFYNVTTEQGVFWYSYQTCIAFETIYGPLVIRQNDWNVTTGKHLSYINPDKSIRISGQDFEAQLANIASIQPANTP